MVYLSLLISIIAVLVAGGAILMGSRAPVGDGSHSRAWIPAFAGMTIRGAGMTIRSAGMTTENRDDGIERE